MNNKKQLLLSIGLVLILVLMIVGISYAAFQFTGLGKKENTITTGAITMKYTETTNVINMTGALPTTDKTGKVRLTEGEYFDFTLEGTIQGTENINWEIAAEDVTTASKKIDGKYIKLYLTSLDDNNNEKEVMAPKVYSADTTENTYTGRPTGMMSLAKGSTSTSFSTKYRLRMYVDESYNPQGDGGDLSFSVKINAYGKTGDKMLSTVAETLQSNGLGTNGVFDTSDPEQTFVTGRDPDNYIWYSGKLWRAVSIDPSDNSVKLVTQWNISSLSYNAKDNSAFKGSYMEQWLNDTSVDGFLGNLREPDKFIKMNSVWNATETNNGSDKPEKTTMVTDTVGLLNKYETVMSEKNVPYLSTGYLNNGLSWWILTPCGTWAYGVYYGDMTFHTKNPTYSSGSRPSINLKPSVKIMDGDGTVDNPYRLQGDNDNPTGTLLSTRYSGEYISFGTGENNLYRIVSHENGTGTKITSATPLKDSGSYKTLAFGSNAIFSKDNTIGTFLNGDYLTSGTYLTSDQVNMIEDNTTWYLGTVDYGANYKLAKYQDTTGNSLTIATTVDKIGLLRYGELMSGQFDKKDNTIYWTLTPYNTSGVYYVLDLGDSAGYAATTYSKGFRPTMNLKSDVVITGGDGTKNSPFQIKLG